ncbi:MAG: GldG family protein [Bryobacterales bacterium]|nr:GldG family protein [Bryobacterales bacterium]
MRTDWIKTRQTRYSGYLTVYILVILAILSGVNWLANRYNKSVDTTANKRFSLSDQTDKVVKNLKQDVTITYWDRTDRFPAAKDLLGRYSNLSSKLHVDYMDPFKKPVLARAAGVKSEGTIILASGTKRQEARSLSEEEVTGALIRLLKGGERKVCFVTGSGEHGLDETGSRGYSKVKDLLGKNNYTTETISLLQKAEVPKDCTVLVVGGPKFDYPQPEVNAIKTYVEAGGRALLLVDPPLQLGRDTIADNPALTALLTGWGVTPQKDLVLDTSGVGQLFGLGPEVPLVTSYESQAIVRDMKEMATAFALPRSLDVKNGDKTSVDKLFSTTSSSFATNNLNSSRIALDPAKDKKGPFVLGAAGTYNSGGAPGTQGRFVVVGSSDWIANYILGFQGNRDLFLNMMNWLSSDEDLISIRPKEPEDRRLNLNRTQMSTIRTVSQFIIPIIIIIGGVLVWWRRR